VAVRALRDVAAVQNIDARRDEVVIAVPDGATAIGPVAIALGNARVAIRDLTLRTPTLDDVFLDLTGARIENHDAAPPTPDTDTDSPRPELDALEVA
jgi:ABC-2 type transport system ATP-binding protein